MGLPSSGALCARTRHPYSRTCHIVASVVIRVAQLHGLSKHHHTEVHAKTLPRMRGDSLPLGRIGSSSAVSSEAAYRYVFLPRNRRMGQPHSLVMKHENLETWLETASPVLSSAHRR